MVTGLAGQVLVLRKIGVKALVLVGALLTASAAIADTGVNRLASDWLGLIDRGAFLTSWTGAAPLLQRQVSAKNWASLVESARRPFGKFVARELAQASQHATLPNMPGGSYWLFVYQAAFANAVATETVTVMEVGGRWLPVGYYIALKRSTSWTRR